MGSDDDMPEFTDAPHRWEIEPHPVRDFDALVTNSDNEARHWILQIAESHLWDDNDGEERTMRVTMNPKIPNAPSDFDKTATSVSTEVGGEADDMLSLVDEVQRRMDAVVDAAVAWAQADGNDAEFDACEELSERVESLLALREKPTESLTPDSSKQNQDAGE